MSARYTTYNLDCRDVMDLYLDENSVDAIVTDPPYGLSFMGKDWDHGVPGAEFWARALRVLKPGGYLLAFGGSRTYHRMASAVEDAGFEIRDQIMWVYGCLSEDSEVLTQDGWMPYNRAKQKNILAYDLQNDTYQWERPSRWNEYRVESDTSYRIQSDHTDQIVSRGHRCIVERGGMLAFVPADELAGVERVPYLRSDFSALPQGRGELLLQAVLREGEGLAQESLSERQGQEVPGEGIAKGEKPSVEGRSDLLQAQGQVRGSVNQVRALPRKRDEHGAQGRVCDGASPCCGAGDWQTSDAGGMRASRQPRCDGQPIGEPDAVCDQCGSQTVRARASYQTTVATVTAIEYSGLIWCPTVSTGAFVARRNGKIFITGNSGFPKSLDVSKAINKAAGAEREVVGEISRHVGKKTQRLEWLNGTSTFAETPGMGAYITAPATEAARQWQGWGTALKPAHEPIVVARKPLIGTVAANVLAHGTGALNIDGCRVGGEIRYNAPAGNKAGGNSLNMSAVGMPDDAEGRTVEGRWPANLIHDGSDEVLAGFPATGPSTVSVRDPNGSMGYHGGASGLPGVLSGHNDTGSAARFFQRCKSHYTDDIWHDLNLPQENANTAEQSSSRQRQAAASALVLAVNSALPEGLLCSGLSMAPFTSATATELKLIADTATQTILSIDSRFWLESKPARLSLSLNHVSDAEIQRLTDTTTITVSRWKSDGYADPVTFSITRKNLEAGEKDCVPSMDGKRFMYCAKASKRDRNAGLDNAPKKTAGVGDERHSGSFNERLGKTPTAPRANHHPTVKPTDLMAYLCRLVTPPGGTVLDPFMGSGSTGKAALREGFKFIGCELDAAYHNIAEGRLLAESEASLKAAA